MIFGDKGDGWNFKGTRRIYRQANNKLYANRTRLGRLKNYLGKKIFGKTGYGRKNRTLVGKAKNWLERKIGLPQSRAFRVRHEKEALKLLTNLFGLYDSAGGSNSPAARLNAPPNNNRYVSVTAPYYRQAIENFYRKYGGEVLKRASSCANNVVKAIKAKRGRGDDIDEELRTCAEFAGEQLDSIDDFVRRARENEQGASEWRAPQLRPIIRASEGATRRRRT